MCGSGPEWFFPSSNFLSRSPSENCLRGARYRLPESVIEWGASTSTPMPTIYDPRPKLRASVTPSTPAATGTVFLDLLPAVPGTYVETAQVGVDIAGILGAPQQRKTITVTYTVTPNDAIDIAFFPASGSLTWKTGTFPQMSLDRMIVVQPGLYWPITLEVQP
jgi:hypothetical protein